MKAVVHQPGVMTIAGFMSPRECAQHIELGEGLGFEAATVNTAGGPKMMTNVRNNERCMFDDMALAEQLWIRVAPELGALELVGTPAGVNERIRIYKYQPGHRFLGHRDGVEELRGLRSELSFLVYLNQGFVGGDTVFVDRSTRSELRIVPKTGDALLFVHGLWHEGTRVDEGVKYVLRSDILCRPR